MKLSLANVRALLPVGEIFQLSYLFSVEEWQKRKVVTQNNYRMLSLILDGVKEGDTITCGWENVTAKQLDDNTFVLYDDMDLPFARIKVNKSISETLKK